MCDCAWCVVYICTGFLTRQQVQQLQASNSDRRLTNATPQQSQSPVKSPMKARNKTDRQQNRRENTLNHSLGIGNTMHSTGDRYQVESFNRRSVATSHETQPAQSPTRNNNRTDRNQIREPAIDRSLLETEPTQDFESLKSSLSSSMDSSTRSIDRIPSKDSEFSSPRQSMWRGHNKESEFSPFIQEADQDENANVSEIEKFRSAHSEENVAQVAEAHMWEFVPSNVAEKWDQAPRSPSASSTTSSVSRSHQFPIVNTIRPSTAESMTSHKGFQERVNKGRPI